MNNFLTKVLPQDSPVYILAYLADGTMHHIVTHSVEEMIARAQENSGRDLYFAVSGYSEGWHQNPYNPERQSLRTQRNSCSQKAFWLDLDVGVEDNKYNSAQDAVDAVCTFSNSIGLPFPTMISSGNGVHCYWVLDRSITTDEWKPLAKRLQKATEEMGLKADPSRTADSASVLRVPGTYNWKDPNNPKPVSSIHDGDIVPVSLMHQVLDSYEVSEGVSNPFGDVIIPPHIKQVLDSGAHGFDWLLKTELVDTAMIVENCRQVRECGTSSRASWLGAFTIICHGENGREWAHKLSSGDPRYSPEDTDYQYTDMSSGQYGPMRCETFEANDPDKCKGCPFYRQIASPISLGKNLKKVAPELVEVGGDPLEDEEQEVENTLVATSGQLMLSDFRGYTHDGGAVFYTPPPKGEKVFPPQLLFPYVPRPLYILVETENKLQSLFYMWEITHNNRKTVVKLPHTEVGSQAKMITWLASVWLLPDPGLHRQAYEYMSVYLRELQTRLPTITKHDRFGWGTGTLSNGDKIPTFVLGEYILTPNNPPSEVEFDGFMLDYAQNTLGSKGTIEGWKEGLKAYNKTDYWAWFGICLGFAAPLMKLFNNSAQNGIVNFYSNESGTGKSTLQAAIGSIWGHPKDQMITVSTHNARLELMGMRKNLPMIMDEITGIEGRELSELIFNMANGTGKLRLNNDSSLKEVKKWETISITSANNTLLDRLLAMSSTREGEQMRAIDVYVPVATKSREEFDSKFNLISENYGVAGHKFIQTILDRPKLYEALPGLLQAKATDISNKASHRFWANTIAAAIIAGGITNTLGLTDINLVELEKYAMEVMLKQSATLNSSKETPIMVLTDYIMGARPNTVVVRTADRDIEKCPVPAQPNTPDRYILALPHNNAIEVRYEKDEQVVYMSSKAFKEWLKENGHGYSFVLDQLERAGIVTPAGRIYLTKDIPNVTRVRTTSYRVDLTKCDIDLDVNEINAMGAQDEEAIV